MICRGDEVLANLDGPGDLDLIADRTGRLAAVDWNKHMTDWKDDKEKPDCRNPAVQNLEKHECRLSEETAESSRI